MARKEETKNQGMQTYGDLRVLEHVLRHVKTTKLMLRMWEHVRYNARVRGVPSRIKGHSWTRAFLTLGIFTPSIYHSLYPFDPAESRTL